MGMVNVSINVSVNVNGNVKANMNVKAKQTQQEYRVVSPPPLFVRERNKAKKKQRNATFKDGDGFSVTQHCIAAKCFSV